VEIPGKGLRRWESGPGREWQVLTPVGPR
jgi:hypothetical protein